MPQITVNTGMDTKPVWNGIKDMNNALRSLRGYVSRAGKEMNASVVGYAKAMQANADASREVNARVQELNEAYSELVRQIDELGNAKIDTQEYAKLKKEITDANKQLQRLEETEQRLVDLNKDAIPTQEFANIKKQLAEIRKKEQLLDKQYVSKESSYNSAVSNVEEIKNQIETEKRLLSELYGKRSFASPTKRAGIDSQITETKTKIVSLNSSLKSAQEKVNQYWHEWGMVEKAYNDAYNEEQKLVDAHNKLIDDGGALLETEAMRRNQYEIQKTIEKLRELHQTKKDMEDNGEAFINGNETEEYANLAKREAELRKEYDSIVSKAQKDTRPLHIKEWEQMSTITGTVSEGFSRVLYAAQMAGHAITHPFEALNRLIPVVLSGLGQLAQKALDVAMSFARWAINNIVNGVKRLASAALNAAASLARMVGSAVVSFLQRLANAAKNAAVQLARVAGKAVVAGLKGIGSLAAQAGKAILGIGKSAKRSNNGLGQAVKMLVRYGFGVRSVFMLVRRLRSALVDAFKNMAKGVPEVNKAISSLSASLGMLKNSMATAFQPILNAIAPILVQFMDMLSEAMTKVGMFFAALVGQDYVYKATKAQFEYAKSLDKTKKSAKEAENQLASFDELNILKAPNDSSSGTGTDANAADAGKFVKTPIESGIKEFVDTLKRMFKSGEFAEIGELLADNINKFIGSIDWNGYAVKIGNLVNGLVEFYNAFMEDINWQNIGTTIASVINGLVDTIDWGALGRAFSQRINAIFGMLAGFVDRVNASNVGTALADAVWGFFGNIKWEEIGGTISNALAKIDETITSFVDNFPWDTLGERLGNGANSLFSGITSTSVGGALIKVIWGVFKLAKKFIETFSWAEHGAALQEKISGFIKDLPVELIGDTMKEAIHGVLDFIMPALEDTSTWTFAGRSLSMLVNKMFGTNQSGETVWTRVSGAIVALAKGVIAAMQGAISEFSWEEHSQGFKDAVMKLVDEFPSDNLGGTLSRLLGEALDFLLPVVEDDKFWNRLGVQFALFANNLFKKDWVWSNIGKTINSTMAGLLEFGDSLLGDFNETNAANSIKAALNEIKWGEIATNLWDNAKLAFKKAGNFLNVLFGEYDIDKYNLAKGKLDYPEELADRFVGGGSLGANIGTRIRKALSEIPWGSIIDELWAAAKEAVTTVGANVGDFMVSLLGVTEEDVEKYGSAGAIGRKFADLISEAFKQSVELAQYLLDSFDSDAFRDGLEQLLSNIDWISVLRGLLTSIGKTGRKALESMPFIGDWFKEQFERLDAITSADEYVKTLKESMGSAFDEIVELGSDKMGLVGDKFLEGFRKKVSVDGKIVPEVRQWLEGIFSESQIIALEKGELTTTEFYNGLKKAGIQHGAGRKSPAVTSILEALEVDLSDGAKNIVDAAADSYVDQANARKQDIQDATDNAYTIELKDPRELVSQVQVTGDVLASELSTMFDKINGAWEGQGAATVDDYFRAFEAKYTENNQIKEGFAAAVDEVLGAGKANAYNTGEMTPEIFWQAWQKHLLAGQPEAVAAIDGAASDVFGNFSEAAERGAAGATDGLWSTFIDTTLANQGEAEEAVLSTFDYLWGAVDAEGNGQFIADGWMYSIIGELNKLKSENPEAFTNVVRAMFGSVGEYVSAKGKGDGKDFMYGIINGMSGEEGDTKDKLVGIIDRVLGYVQHSPEGFDSNSPSKRAAGYGEDFMKGFVQGVGSEEDGTKKSTVGVFDNIFGGIVASAAALALLNLAVSVSMNSMSDKMSTTLATISSSFSTAWASIGNSVIRSVNNIVYNVPRLFGEMGRSITDQGWWSVGDQIVAGIQGGVQDNWHWLNRTVWNLAISLYNTARNALGIHSPSRLFREGVGQMLGLGVAEGFEDTEPTIMNSVTEVADAMVDKMARTDMQFDVGTETALSSFSDKIADSFATLLDRLQAIADSVTFRTPAVAAGTVVPYNVAARAGGDSTGLVEALEVSNDDLASVIIQATNNAAVAIVDAIQRHGGINNPNVSAQTNAIIDEINRRTRANGASPILM